MQPKNSAQPTDVANAAKHATRGALLLFIGNTFSTVILSLAVMVIARLLGPSDYGLYSIAITVPSLMLFSTDFGVSQALVRFTAKFRSERLEGLVWNLVKTGICFELATALLMFSVTLCLSSILATYVVNRPGMTQLIQISSAAILGNALFLTSNRIFVGLDQTDKAALLPVLNSLIKVIVAPILILLGFGVAGALVGHVLGLLVAAALGSLITLRICSGSKYRSHIDSSFISNLLPMIRFGIPLHASNLIAQLFLQYQTIILPWFTSDFEMGNYFVAATFSSAVALLTTPISPVLFAAFSKFDPSKNTPDLKSFFRYSLRYMLFLVIPVMFFTAVTSKDLAGMFYGSEYVEAPLYLSIYSMTFLVAPLTLVLGAFFGAMGRTGMVLQALLIQLSVAVPSSIVFTSLYKIPGFIFATTISAMLPVVYLGRAAHRQYGLEFDSRHMIRILLASFLSSIPAVSLTPLPYSHVLKVVVSATLFTLTYMTVSPILGAIKRVDIANLRETFKRMGVISRVISILLSYEERILSAVNSRQIDGRSK
ncbi:oligosaccharide flippase family protein [Candidatus Bathyarchaeota archaeon]|nr:oligosaccharide flippase family protein [Candidatus Bathyarchaeota archaeon]